MNATLAIEYLPLTDLTPYARNSRTHSPEQVAALAHSIRTYGFNNPVLVDADGLIVAGHGRVLAAAQAGLAQVPCIRLLHLTEAQRRAYVIADNKMADMGGWDMATLAGEIEELLMDADAGLELMDFGLDDDAFAGLADFLPDAGTPKPAKAKPQPAAPTPAAPGAAPTAGAEDPDNTPTADDYADVGQGATNPAEGKALQYPLILQLNKPTFQLWRKFKGKRSDTEAIEALLQTQADATDDAGQEGNA